MVKKRSKKTKSKKSSRSGEKKTMTAKERQEMIIENFVGLQHAMTNLSIRFENMSDHIISLLQVFEEAAKNFMSGGKDNDLIKKVDNLIEQNKTIAKGLVLVEEKLKGSEKKEDFKPSTQSYPSKPMLPSSRPHHKPLPRL